MIERLARSAYLTTAGLFAACCAPVAAQDVYGPSLKVEFDDDVAVVLADPKICEDEVQDSDTIVVCRERIESERYMSPVPRPVDGNRGLMLPPDVSTLPPCVHAPPLSLCPKLGSSPPPVPMVDTTAFPEPLSPQDADRVIAVEAEPGT